MNETANPAAPAAATPPAAEHDEAAAERSRLTYIGHALPWPIVLIWAAYLLFGLIYFLFHL